MPTLEEILRNMVSEKISKQMREFKPAPQTFAADTVPSLIADYRKLTFRISNGSVTAADTTLVLFEEKKLSELFRAGSPDGEDAYGAMLNQALGGKSAYRCAFNSRLSMKYADWHEEYDFRQIGGRFPITTHFSADLHNFTFSVRLEIVFMINLGGLQGAVPAEDSVANDENAALARSELLRFQELGWLAAPGGAAVTNGSATASDISHVLPDRSVLGGHPLPCVQVEVSKRVNQKIADFDFWSNIKKAIEDALA